MRYNKYLGFRSLFIVHRSLTVPHLFEKGYTISFATFENWCYNKTLFTGDDGYIFEEVFSLPILNPINLTAIESFEYK